MFYDLTVHSTDFEKSEVMETKKKKNDSER